jgi:hypothetical protein
MQSTTATVATPTNLATNNTQTLSAYYYKLRLAPSSAQRNQLNPVFNQHLNIPSNSLKADQEAEYKRIYLADANAEGGLSFHAVSFC